MAGIAVAGDGAGIAGGTAAAERGRARRRAAVGRALKPASTLPDRRSTAPGACKREEMAAPSSTAVPPPPRFRHPEGDTIVCRCEEVTARRCRRRETWREADQMKAFLRCGMGPCQGRLCCGLTVTELIAAAQRPRPRRRSATTACARR